MSSRPRSVSFNAVGVHRLEGGRGAGRPAEGSPRLRFSDLLRARRGATTPPTGAADPGDPIQAAAVDPDHLSDGSSSDDGDSPDGDARAAEALDVTPALAEPRHMLLLERASGGALVAAAADAPLHPLVASIGQTVARFCNERAVSESEGWQVRIPLREDVLPDTTLHLALSSYWLQLRFETRSQMARDLLLIHRGALARTLEDALHRRREVAIEID
jgi:type III secretion control protein HpaP